MARKATGKSKATKELLDLKYGDWLPNQLRMGTNPWSLAQMISEDGASKVVDVEQRDPRGKVTGTQPTDVPANLQVTGEQLKEWYPNSTEMGEPEGGHAKPDPRDQDKATDPDKTPGR